MRTSDGSSVGFNLDQSAFESENIITSDVCVIGGGASGAYTAIRLQDHGKSVVVVEARGRLGGHAETYKDPETGLSLDVGVIVFGHLKEVKDLFARYGVPLKIVPTSLGPPDFTDVLSGELVEYFPPTQEEISIAMKRYATELAKYPEIQKGYYIPDPVPGDLLLPFGKFVTKYSLGALVPTIFVICQGYTPLLEISTLYVFKYFNQDLLNTLSKGFLMTERHNAGEIYEKILAQLGPNALLSSKIISMNRSNVAGPVRLLVETPTGHQLILAKKIVTTIPLTLSNLQGFDLSTDESSIFAQHFHSSYYSCILRNSYLPMDKPIQSCDLANSYAIPELPGIYTMHPDRSTGLMQIYYGSPHALSEDEIRADILAVVDRIRQAKGIHIPSNSPAPEFAAFANHSPFNMMAPREAIQSGFYKQLYDLQGQRHTWYNGSSVHAQDSSVLWRFTEELLPRILNDLEVETASFKSVARSQESTAHLN